MKTYEIHCKNPMPFEKEFVRAAVVALKCQTPCCVNTITNNKIKKHYIEKSNVDDISITGSISNGSSQ